MPPMMTIVFPASAGMGIQGLSKPEFSEAGFHVFEVEIETAEFAEFLFIDVLGDLFICEQLLEEVGIITALMLGGPCLHGVTLHKRVCLFAGESLADECKQHGL